MTPAQLRTFELIRDGIATMGVVPKQTEIAHELGVSKVRVCRIEKRLCDMGYLEKSHTGRRIAGVVGVPDLRRASTDQLRDELARRGETLDALRVPQERAYGRQPSCRVDSCGFAVQRGHVMCRKHWFAVPADLRNAVLAAHSRAVMTRSQEDASRYQDLLTRAADLAEKGGA